MKRCDGVHRREFLRVGALSAFGLSLADALRLRAATGSQRSLRNCILIWLDGGPSHLDTFDPKPDAPAEVRGPFQAIATAVAGIRVCEHFPNLAREAGRLCIIRSMTSRLGEHNLGRHYLLTGYQPSPVLNHPSIGSVVAHCRESRSVLPPYIAVPNVSQQGRNGFLPVSTAPFAVGGDPSRPDFRVRDLEAPRELTGERLERRRDFVAAFDRLSRQVEENPYSRERDAAFAQAYGLIASNEARAAFNLRAERPNLRQRYGMHRLGQSCLLARRLVEAGCSFVTVTDDGWDTHVNLYTRLREGFTGGRVGKIPRLDQAMSALLADLNDRGMLSQTLVVVMGEFGRTPKMNTRAGRDHWPRAFSVVLAGGGVRGGQVIGASDGRGESVAERPVTPADLAATVYTLLGLDPSRELHTPDGRPIRLSTGQVVRECLD